jgi:hypothetical protein
MAAPPVVNSAYVELNGIPHYGLDAENILKAQARRDVPFEMEIKAWIEAVLNEELPAGDLSDSLQSGILLCRVLNELRPDTIKKINERPVALMQRENVGMYLEACAKVWKLPPAHLFIISDLFDKRDLRPYFY